MDSFPQVKYTCVIWRRAKSSIFKKLVKHWFGSLHLKLGCGASLNAQEVTREKKVDMGENFSPKPVQIDRLLQVKYTCADLGKG